jgi:acetyl-CoA decarbonylase/synthase complex subunit gamma
MALTGMQIYKNLPKTNCKDCGLPTCMAFAMQVAAKQRALTDCPHLSDDAQSALSEASAPPMKLVKIGTGEKAFTLGQETVMFRHEEKFHRQTGIAVLLPASLNDEDVTKKLDKIKGSIFERVGTKLSVALVAVELDGVADPAARIKTVTSNCKLPIILMTKKADILKQVIAGIKAENPLIWAADTSNIQDFSQIAAANKLPLAIEADNLEQLAELTQKAKQQGVEDIVLSFATTNLGDTLRALTIARRAALKKAFRALGYPAMATIAAKDSKEETILASIFAAKYSGIVVINGCEPWELIPILTTIQDVYTDPQVPNMVEAELVAIGNVNENSPVLFTTNFSLTYFSVAGEVERSKIPTYISVVETEGLGVLNAYAGDKISAEKIVKTLKEQGVAEKVKHRKLIIPGLLPIFRAEIEDTSEWKEVIIGPESAREIPAFLTKTWK